MPRTMTSPATLAVNGVDHALEERATTASLLDTLRALGLTSVKDGCAPQGQCGCCTVWVDGKPRVACVTPTARVLGRSVTTLEGVDPSRRAVWVDAFLAAGASQCGFCTPGILMRLIGTFDRPQPTNADNDVRRALLAHQCRCTGWQPIVQAARADLETPLSTAGAAPAASQRASLESRCPQRIDADTVMGCGGFSCDLDPAGFVARRDEAGDWQISTDTATAREAWPRVQGRNPTWRSAPPLEPPAGSWDLVLATSWVDACATEPASSFCAAGAGPSSPEANGGSFGSKSDGSIEQVARELATTTQQSLTASETREDELRRGPKRPPLSLGISWSGQGVVHVPDIDGIEPLVALHLPHVRVQRVVVAGPPISLTLRSAVSAEMAAIAAVLHAVGEGHDPTRHEHATTWSTPRGAVSVHDSPALSVMADATATVQVHDGIIHVLADAGEIGHKPTARSYITGAVHHALGMVLSERLTVDSSAVVHSLSLRSLGILRAVDMPTIHIEFAESTGSARALGDAVFSATLAATWWATGLGPTWPVL